MDGGEIDKLLALVGFFGTISMAIYWGCRIEMEKIRARNRASEESVTQQSLNALREEVERLRDTSTKFDVSFDASLSRLEERVDRLETRAAAALTAVNLQPKVDEEQQPRAQVLGNG